MAYFSPFQINKCFRNCTQDPIYATYNVFPFLQIKSSKHVAKHASYCDLLNGPTATQLTINIQSFDDSIWFINRLWFVADNHKNPLVCEGNYIYTDPVIIHVFMLISFDKTKIKDTDIWRDGLILFYWNHIGSKQKQIELVKHDKIHNKYFQQTFYRFIAKNISFI